MHRQQYRLRWAAKISHSSWTKYLAASASSVSATKPAKPFIRSIPATYTVDESALLGGAMLYAQTALDFNAEK
jgi:hypothetical protein